MKKSDLEWVLGKGVKFERIRRITGYLVGTLDRFNDAKRAEEHDRVKHGYIGKNIMFQDQSSNRKIIAGCCEHYEVSNF